MRYEFKTQTYSFVIVEGVECFYEAYDKGDNDGLFELLVPRAEHELSCIDDEGEAFENCYYDIMEHIRHSQIGCNCFKKISIDLSKTIEELVFDIFWNIF